MLVLESEFPRLYKALDIIAYDGGVPSVCGVYRVDALPAEYAGLLEKELEELSDDDLENFCIGEVGEQDLIRRRSIRKLALGLIFDRFYEDGTPCGVKHA